jgi:hypothetical protein
MACAPGITASAGSPHPARHLPGLVTGTLTATSGAWNATIVAEVVTWGHTTLTATGANAANAGAPRTLVQESFGKLRRTAWPRCPVHSDSSRSDLRHGDGA